MDKIRINHGKFKKVLEATLTVISFVDKDTQQNIKYVPTLDISSYGKTEDKAKIMLNEALQLELNRVLNMNDKQAKAYLVTFGWKVQPSHNKNLSHVVIDKHGVLQGFNVDVDSVKEEQVNVKEQLAVLA